MSVKNALKPLGFLLIGCFATLGTTAPAATYTWTGTSGGSWGATANWTTASGTWPGTSSDTVVISNTTGLTQNVFYDAGALGTTGTISTLNLVQPTSGTNQLSLIRSFRVMNDITIGGTSGATIITLDTTQATGSNGVTLTAPSITVGTNSTLALTTSGTTPTYASIIGANVNIAGGSFIQYNDYNQTITNAAVCQVTGNLAMTSGTIVIGGTPSSYTASTSTWSPRLQINGTINISGGVFSAAGNNTQVLLINTGSNSITGLFATSSTISNLQLNSSSGTQSFVSDSSLGNAYIVNLTVRPNGSTTRYIGSNSTSGTLAIGSLQFGQQTSGATTTIHLTSSVLASSGAPLSTAYTPSTGGTATFVLDLAGYSFLGASVTGSISPGSTNNPLYWSFQNTGATTGTIQAGVFNFATAAGVNVGGTGSTGAVTLVAIGTGTNNLGTSGTFAANSIFSYIGNGTGYLTSGHDIGGISVGTGSNSSILTLASNITTGSGSQVTINKGASLVLGSYTLTMTPDASGSAVINNQGTFDVSGQTSTYTVQNGQTIANIAGTVKGNLNIADGGVVSMVPIGTSNQTGAAISGNVVMSGGQLIVYRGPVYGNGSPVYLQGNFTMTGGTVNIGVASGGAALDNRIYINGNATISGGSIINSNGSNNTGGLFFNGATNSITNLTTAYTGGVTLSGTINQTLAVDDSSLSPNATLTIRAASSGTLTRTVGSTTGHTLSVYSLTFGEQASNSTVVLKLSSNLATTAASGAVNATWGVTNANANYAIDTNGYNLNLTSNTAGFNPLNVSGSSPVTWYLQNSGTSAGTISALGFVLTSATQVNVGDNVILKATGNIANNLGNSTSGTISASSTFWYTGSSATVSSGRTVGQVVVGDGTNASTLALGSNINTDLSSQVNVQAGATLDLQGHTLSTGGVNIGNGANLAGSGVVSAPVNVNGGSIKSNGVSMGDTTFHGTSSVVGSATASNMTVADGATTVSGNATATNTFTVSTGAQLTNTGTTGANTVAVAAGATLTNNGLLNGNVNVSGLFNGTGAVHGALSIKSGGELSPGNSPGSTAVTGDLTVETGAKVSMQVLKATVTDSLVAGSNYDQISVTGGVTIQTGAILNLTLANMAVGDVCDLILNDGIDAISGAFSSVLVNNNAVTLDGNSFTYDGLTYDLSYTANADGGTSGNDMTLTVVPEPSTWAMVAGGLGMLVGFRRMRRRW